MWLAIIALVITVAAIAVSFLTIFRDALVSPLRDCPTDYCVSNIISGAKRCPEQGQSISRLSTAEVCNPRRSCTDGLTPNLLYDFTVGTVTNNFCPINVPDEKCLCMNSAYCPVQYTSYFTTVGDRILTNTSYLNPIVRNITVSNRPFATMLNNGTCTITAPERLWPPDLSRENKCLNGRLVRLFDSSQYVCMSTADLDQINCIAPNRIVQLEDGNFSCTQ